MMGITDSMKHVKCGIGIVEHRTMIIYVLTLAGYAKRL